MNVHDYILPTVETNEIIEKRAEVERLDQAIIDFSLPASVTKDMSCLMQAQLKMAIMTSYDKFGLHDHAPRWERDFIGMIERVKNLREAIKAETHMKYDIVRLAQDISTRTGIKEEDGIYFTDLHDGRIRASTGEDPVEYPDISIVFKENGQRFNDNMLKARFFDVDIKDLEKTLVYLSCVIQEKRDADICGKAEISSNSEKN